ncbi:MAG TPA: hypothetical protein VJS85_07505 [Rhizomicrobium sp.]|nr:hypothetical protein [Rhizomicrobium sp.]
MTGMITFRLLRLGGGVSRRLVPLMLANGRKRNHPRQERQGRNGSGA